MTCTHFGGGASEGIIISLMVLKGVLNGVFGVQWCIYIERMEENQWKMTENRLGHCIFLLSRRISILGNLM